MKTGINGGFYYRGGSMLRVFRAGDRLLPVPKPFRSLKRGDVICFLPPGSRTRVVHRIVGCGENSFRTQGDNNARPDRLPVTPGADARCWLRPESVAGGAVGCTAARSVGSFSASTGSAAFAVASFPRSADGCAASAAVPAGLRLVSRAGRGLLYAGDTVAAVRRADGEGWRLRRGWRFFYSADELNRLYPVPGRRGGAWTAIRIPDCRSRRRPPPANFSPF